MKTNTWYKATITQPTPRTVYVPAVKLAWILFMIFKNGYCQFYMAFGIDVAEDEVPIYSCTKKTALRKFKFEEI
jgi:hypothetical protein